MITNLLGNQREEIRLKMKRIGQTLIFGSACVASALTFIAAVIYATNGPSVLWWLLPLFAFLLVIAGLGGLGAYGAAWLYLLIQQRKEEDDEMFP
jgi:hypothetical protein